MINSYLKTAGKNSIIYFPGRIIPSIVGFLSIPFFTKLLGTEKYGDYSLIVATISIFIIFTEGWIENSTVRFYPHNKGNRDINDFLKTIFLSLIFNVLIFSIIYLIIVFFFCQFKTYFYLIKPAIFGLTAFWGMTLFRSLNAIFRAKQSARHYSVNAIIFSIGKFALAVFLLFIMGNDIENIFVGTLIISAFIIPIMLRYLNIRRFLINGHYSKEKLIEYLSFGWPFTLIMISSWMLNLFNRYIIKIYCGSKEVGIYSAIFNLSDQSLSFIFMGLMLAVYPVLVKAWEIEGEEVTSRLITKFIRYYFILCLPVLIGLIILGDLVVNIFTTKDFEAGIKIIPYVAMSSFLIGLNQYFTKPLELKKRSKLLSLFMIVGAIINVSLAFILIPQYGLKGAAISTLISYVVLTLINWYVGKRYIKYLIPKISIIRVSIAVIFMGIIIEFLKNQLVENIFNLFFIIILSVFLYLLFLILIGEIKKSEITYLKGLIGLNNFSK